LLLSGCGTSLYYSTLERFGQDKRDILVSRVRSGQEDQRAAEEQFLTTYELLKQLSSFDGGDLARGSAPSSRSPETCSTSGRTRSR
jgi:hypothetical protein